MTCGRIQICIMPDISTWKYPCWLLLPIWEGKTSRLKFILSLPSFHSLSIIYISHSVDPKISTFLSSLHSAHVCVRAAVLSSVRMCVCRKEKWEWFLECAHTGRLPISSCHCLAWLFERSVLGSTVDWLTVGLHCWALREWLWHKSVPVGRRVIKTVV